MTKDRTGGIDDDQLRGAVRGALGDIVGRSPRSLPPPEPIAEPHRSPPPSNRGRWALAAAVLTAAAGLVGVVVLRDDEADRDRETAATAGPPVSTIAPTTTVPSPPVVALPNQTLSPCGPVGIPAAAADVQTAEADIDGDTVDDMVTLYRIGTEWHVEATSSVKGWASDTIVTLDVDDEAALTFENVDYSLGAETPPPVAVMVTGSGANDLGIIANFTFLSNTPDYCIAQWSYTPRDKPTEPFQWVARRAEGIATGMRCEGAAGSRHYYLYDSTANLDGSWRVVTRKLTHDFTTAEIAFDPIRAFDASPEFLDQYASIVGCDHAPV